VQASPPLSISLTAGTAATAGAADRPQPPIVTPVEVLGTRLHHLSWERALDVMHSWAAVRESRVVIACNVHSLVTARLGPAFRQVIHRADLAAADGAPVAWMMRRLGCTGQQRISGPDLMWRYFAAAAPRGEAIYLYGGEPQTLERLVERIRAEFPGLRIAGTWSPPFRDLTPEEDQAAVDRINASGAQTVWVSLGCPKQELWMTEHRDRIHAVQVGVGAAFAYHAGVIRRAPGWMQRNGLEWLHRLCSEPRRLWKRYALTNSLFILWAAWQLLLQPSQRRAAARRAA
jgi:N-acetylglucosaminyldiphosphoundecaprenol N-acetyl-beta-D-mannosaminyltransferase